MAYAALSTRNSSGLHPSLRGMGFLGDASLTPTTALQQAMQAEGMTGNLDFSNDAWLSAAEGMVSQAQIPPSAFSPACAGMAAPNVNLFNTASGLALGTTSATTGILSAAGVIGAGTGALLGAVTMGAGLIISVIGMIFAHHAAAVKQEQQLGCAALAAANNALNLIQQAVANGQTTPDAASQALDTLLSQFSSYVSPSVKHNPCNADCEITVILKAIVLYLQAQYAALTANAVANAADYAAQQNDSTLTPASSLTSPVISSSAAAAAVTTPATGLAAVPLWAWIALGLGAVWMVA